VSSVSGNKEQDRIGLQELGSAYATFSAEDDVGYRDRITFADSTIRYTEVIFKSEQGKNDKLNFKAINIMALKTIDATYNQGEHFTLSDDGLEIVWDPSFTGINAGEMYSVLYNMHPAYIALNPIHEIRGTYTMYHTLGQEVYKPLPKQFMIKREDFVVHANGTLQSAW